MEVLTTFTLTTGELVLESTAAQTLAVARHAALPTFRTTPKVNVLLMINYSSPYTLLLFYFRECGAVGRRRVR